MPRFGTVRPRVQIPGPRQILYSESAIPAVVNRQLRVAGSQNFAEHRKRLEVTMNTICRTRVDGSPPTVSLRSSRTIK